MVEAKLGCHADMLVLRPEERKLLIACLLASTMSCLVGDSIMIRKASDVRGSDKPAGNETGFGPAV